MKPLTLHRAHLVIALPTKRPQQSQRIFLAAGAVPPTPTWQWTQRRRLWKQTTVAGTPRNLGSRP